MKIDKIFSNLEVMKPQSFEDMVVFPLSLKIDNIPYFITLDSALKTRKFLIKEVHTFGEVPVLKVINHLSEQVLILDGEELRGGKQNRVVNTSILVKKNSELVIPVSCTEAHRWHYISDVFEDPDVIPIEIRKGKTESLLRNLLSKGEFESDQGLIWDMINRYHMDYDVDSETSAIRDVYEKEKDKLKDRLKKFPYIDGQNGILVYVDGRFEGMDIVPLTSAYKELHEKLIKSYLFRRPLKKKNNLFKEENEKIFDEISKIEPLKFKSVGLGWDLRYGDDKYIGSMLVYRNKPIHINFLRRTMYSKAV
ncbi:MAG: DUF6569 family protein [Dictyoglomus thermophilum]